MNPIQGYKKLPKGLRFALFYGAMPVWLPIAMVGVLTGYLLCAAIVSIGEAWEQFK